MSLFFYSGSKIGIEKKTLSSGDGIVSPFLQQVQAVNYDRIRFTFNREMNFGGFIGGDLVDILNPAYFIVKEQLTSNNVNIVRVYKRSDTEVEAICENLLNLQYTAEVSSDIEDIYGVKIGSNNTATFTGLVPTFPEINNLYGFFGLQTGIQLVDIPGIAPDAEGPIVSNKDPDSGDTVHIIHRVSFDITDENGVNADSIVVRINDNVAWQNNTEQDGFTVTKTTIIDGYHFDIDSNEPFPSYSAIPVRIQASDLWPIPNSSDTQWSFNTGARGPYAIYQYPSPDGTGTSNSLITVKVIADSTLRKESVKIWVKPGDDERYELAFEFDADPKFTTLYNGVESIWEPIEKGIKVILDRTEEYKVGEDIDIIIHAAETA